MVQGDREAPGKIGVMATALAMVLGQRVDVCMILGAYGRLVELFRVGHRHVIYHGMHSDDYGHAEVTQYVDCATMAATLGTDAREIAWGLRLGHMMAKADAFIFFSGREGTVAHLMPVLAFAAKTEQSKPIALVGWDEEKISALTTLMGGKLPKSVGVFSLESSPQAIVNFLMT